MHKVATKKALQNILSQAYAEKVSEEVVELILQPGLDPGAPDVFLDFISYRCVYKNTNLILRMHGECESILIESLSAYSQLCSDFS